MTLSRLPRGPPSRAADRTWVLGPRAPSAATSGRRSSPRGSWSRTPAGHGSRRGTSARPAVAGSDEEAADRWHRRPRTVRHDGAARRRPGRAPAADFVQHAETASTTRRAAAGPVARRTARPHPWRRWPGGDGILRAVRLHRQDRPCPAEAGAHPMPPGPRSTAPMPRRGRPPGASGPAGAEADAGSRARRGAARCELIGAVQLTVRVLRQRVRPVPDGHGVQARIGAGVGDVVQPLLDVVQVLAEAAIRPGR